MSIWTATDVRPAKRVLTAQHAAVVLFAVGLLWPLCWISFNAVSLTAFYEESIGYRYFYTLRQLHEPVYLFLPQGQSVNLVFKFVHATLDLLGFPPTQIRPRIDYFCIISIAVLQFINVAAFSSLLRQSPRAVNPFLAALFWLLPVYALGPSTGYILLMPDYLAVEPAIAMFSAALLLKVYSDAQWTRTNASWLAILLGFALATKVTLAILPGIAILFLVLNSPSYLRSILSAAAVTAAGLFAWLILIGLDVAFVPGRLVSYVFGLYEFIRTGGGMGTPPDAWLWWILSRAREVSPVVAFIYLMPFLGLAALAFVRERKTLNLMGCMLLGACVYSVILYRRDYYVTLIDSGLYTFMFAWCAWCTASAWRSGVSRHTRMAIDGITAVLLVIFAAEQLVGYAAHSLPAIQQSAAAERQLDGLNQRIVGRRLWLVPDNYGRPISIESAIMKGGSSMTGVWLEPDSALIRNAVQGLEFRFERNDNRPVNLNDYSAVFFMAKDDLKERQRSLNERYRIDLFQLQCSSVLQMETGALVMCSH